MRQFVPEVMLGFALSAGFAGTLAAQTAPQVTLPPIRPLGAIIATSPPGRGESPPARLLRDGRVLVYDPRTRRVVMYDAALSHPRTLVDSATLRPGSHSAGPPLAPLAALVALPGDSTALFEATSGSLLVIAPSGDVARAVAIPQSALPFGATGQASKPFGDAHGRIVFREPPPLYLAMVRDGFLGDTIIAGPDSFPLLRFNPATHRTDTVTMVRAPRVRQAVTKRERGGRGTPAIDPVPVAGDDWVQLDDGTIAIVRIGDYHVDWLRPSGTLTRGPHVAHEWTAITDSMKVALVAAARTARGADRADSLFPIDSARFDSLALVVAANPDAFLGPNGKPVGLGPAPQRLMFVSPSDLPDRWPPFTSGGTVADADGTLWVPSFPVTNPGGGQVFDVVGPNGVLVDRVKIPANAMLLGVSRGVALLRVSAPPGQSLALARTR